MQTPIQIVFHGIAHSDAVESQVRERAGKLEQIHPKLMRCHVTIDQPHRHKHQGNKFSVRLSLHVPGEEIVVNKDAAEDVYIALRDAFDAARRALEEAARRLRMEVRGGRAAAQGQAS